MVRATLFCHASRSLIRCTSVSSLRTTILPSMCGSNLQEAFSTSSILDCLRSFGALGLLCIGTSTSTTAELSSNSSASFGASIVLHRRRRIDPVSGIVVWIIPSGCNSLSIVRAKLCLLKKMVMTYSY
jgi:hypothetical protein